MAETSDITMPQLAAELAALGTRVAPASISRLFIRNGYRFKKTMWASEQERLDVRQARAHWCTKRQPRMREEPHRLVFIDETGTTTKMTRLRGRCVGGDFSGARANVFRAAVRGGWLQLGTGAITDEGRRVLAGREERRGQAA